MPRGTRFFRRAVVLTPTLTLLVTLLSSRAEAQNGNHRWSAFLSGRGGFFHSGLDTPVGSLAATDSLANATASLTYSRYTRTSLITVAGFASNLLLSDLDFSNYGGSASGFKDLSNKATLRFGAGGSKGFNYNDLIVNSIFVLDQNVVTYYATTGLTYDFSPSTSAFTDLSYSRFRLDVDQEIDGSQFAFAIPFDDDALSPQIPTNLPFSSATAENILDASSITARLLATEGTITNELTTDIYALSTGVSHQLSPRTDVTGRAGYRWLTYRRPSLVEGADWYGGIRLGHDFNPKTDASVEYTVRQNRVAAPSVSSHTVLGRVGRQLSVPIHIAGSFGVTYVPVRGNSPLASTPQDFFPSTFMYIGGGSLSGEFARTAFSLDYRHQAQHSIGIGRFLTSDFGSAGINHVFARDLFAYAYTGYRFSRGTFDDTFSFGVLVAGGDIRYRINEDFSIGASYLFRHLDRDTNNLDSHMLSAVLSFAKIWR